MNTGIYTITAPSGRIYIGSAVNFTKRWTMRRHDLRKGTHHCEPLQAAHDKYGMAALRFNKILICERRHLLLYEQLLIDAHSREAIYNTCYIAGNREGTRHSTATRVKMSESQTGRKASPETRAKLSRAKLDVPKPSNLSGHCGVSHFRDRWQASVTVDGKRYHVGVFMTVEQARDARDAFIAKRRLSVDTR